MNDEGMPKSENTRDYAPELTPQARKLWMEAKKWETPSLIRASSFFRHSSFVIRHFPPGNSRRVWNWSHLVIRASSFIRHWVFRHSSLSTSSFIRDWVFRYSSFSRRCPKSSSAAMRYLRLVP